MLLRGSKKDVPTIARELNVRYVLEGSVRRAGQSLRITAQLIDAAADAHLWAEKYTGTLEDVFDMQERVSRAIVEALKLELTPQEQQRMAERPIPNIHAYECYLKARREIWRFVGPSLDKAMEYLEQGLRAVPDNPLLLAGVGYVHFQRLNMGVGSEDSLGKAETFATRALELAPDLPQAHVVLGLITSWHRGMIKTAIAHFDQVLSADPNDQDALKWSGVFYAYVGRTRRSGCYRRESHRHRSHVPHELHAPRLLSLAGWAFRAGTRRLGTRRQGGCRRSNPRTHAILSLDPHGQA